MDTTLEQPSVSEVEIGETYEIVVDGNRIEAFLSDNVVALDPKSIHTRRALRAYAWSLAAAGNRPEAKDMLKLVGRED